VSRRDIVIRRATADDSPSVKALARSLATTFSVDDDTFDEVFIRVRENEGAQILVSVDERGVIDGYLLGFVHDAFFANGPVAWIEEMYVIDSARRSAVGRALEEEFDTWARSRDAKLIALATRRAASFYLAIGYEESAVYFRRIL
jgi:GNAT superfamily N-acetyltransferase